MTAPATAGLGTVPAVQGNIRECGTTGRQHAPEVPISCQRSMRVKMQEVCVVWASRQRREAGPVKGPMVFSEVAVSGAVSRTRHTA